MATWTEQVIHYPDVAATEPRAYALHVRFVFGLQHRWTIIECQQWGMQPLEDVIHDKFILRLAKHEPSDPK